MCVRGKLWHGFFLSMDTLTILKKYGTHPEWLNATNGTYLSPT